jgi:hypothetical protein
MKEKFRVWWIPQVPMEPFYVNVKSITEARKIIGVLADYDAFQYENKIKPDYSNVGGLEVFDKEDITDSADGSWVEWYDEDGNDISSRRQ